MHRSDAPVTSTIRSYPRPKRIDKRYGCVGIRSPKATPFSDKTKISSAVDEKDFLVKISREQSKRQDILASGIGLLVNQNQSALVFFPVSLTPLCRS